MDTQRIDEKAVFNAARQIPDATDREAYLARIYGDDHPAIERMRELLRIHEQEQSFLESPAAGFAATNNIGPLSEQPGALIGPYKLLQQIGEGGMGIVYMAEQTEPVARRVALKIIKSGMDTRQVIARFEAERQALALMDHPNIAKILDAGTELGRPYFVMELVRGVPIVQYCDEHRLTPAQRLKLFIAVCHAVQHAHQKGIIHRDLKPTNILVADYDDKPVAKVIDFGVAKAIGQELTEKTMFTQFGQMVGTLEYMSPEQAKLNQLDIDTRSDIYSLGVLLYELLTGTTPFGRGRLQSAAFDEMLRIIREEEPEKPSTRLSTTKELPSIAACRQLEPKKLAGLMKGELDWVVMKSLEKDRGRRYETANAFAQDIERYLHDEPVTARPTSSLYRAGKTIKRNRLAFAAACCVVTALVLGGIVSTWQAIRATRSEHEQSRLLAEAEQARTAEEELRQRAEAGEKQARTEATKSQQVAKFMQEMLTGAKPWVAMGRDTSVLRAIVDSTSKRLDKELAEQPAVEAALRSTLGSVYNDIGYGQQAETMFRRAIELQKQLYGDEHAEIALSLHNLGDALYYQAKYSEAESSYRQALAMQKKLLGEEQPDVAETLLDLSQDLGNQGKLSEGEALAREALAMDRKLFGDDSLPVADALHKLSDRYHQEYRYAEMESALREALAIRRKHLDNDSHEVIENELFLAWALEDQKKYDDAEPLVRHVVEIKKKIFGKPGLWTLYVLGKILAGQYKLPEAEQTFRQALAESTTGGVNNRRLPDLNMSFAMVLRQQGKLAEAETAARRAIEWESKVFGDQNTYYVKDNLELASILRDEGKLDEAEAIDRLLLAKYKNVKGGQYNVPYMYIGLVNVLQSEGRLADAEAAARQGIVVQKQLGGDQDRFMPLSLIPLADVLLDEGKLADAERTIQDSLAMLEKRFGGETFGSVNARVVLAGIQSAKHQFTDAEKNYRDALAHQAEHLFNVPLSPRDGYLDLAKTLEQFSGFLRERDQAAAAETVQRESLEKVTAAIGADQPLVAEIKGQLAQSLLAEGKPVEAESLARQALELEQKFSPDAWPAFRAQCLLGQCLLAQKKYSDAEPLMQSGYEGMEKLTHSFPVAHGNEIRQALRSLTQLSEATGQSDKAAQWQQKLTDLEKAESSSSDVSQTSSN